MSLPIPSFIAKYCNQALRDAFMAALVLWLVAALTGYIVYFNADKALKQEVQGNLLSIAQAAAHSLDGDLHQQVTEPDHKGNDIYEKARAPFFNLLKANPNIAFIYTVIPKDDKIFFILDSKIMAPGQEDDTSDVMEEYTESSEFMQRALSERKSYVEDESYTDEWGTFLSAYAPIYNSRQEYIGVVGADMRLTDYLARLSNIYNAMFISMALATLASIGIGIAVWFVRTAAMKSEDRNRQQQELMNKMELSRLAEQEEQKIKAEEEKRAVMHALADGFENTVNSLMDDVSISVEKISESITRVGLLADDTKERTTIVASASNEAAHMSAQVSAAAEELTSSVQEIRSQTQRAMIVAEEATSTAHTAQHDIESLSEKSLKVTQIVSVITTIAEQINLLALNATIEAARAGEAGKGFAVVAGEVKSLASQAGKAADEIAQQINDMQTATSMSVDAVMKIINIIENVSHTTAAIAGAVEQQSAATNEIAANISHASDGTQRISTEIVSVERGADQTGETVKLVEIASKQMSKQCVDLKNKMVEFVSTIRKE